MNKREKRLEVRQKNWEALFEKYEIEGHQNAATCFVHEVNYKLFNKPTVKTKIKVRKIKRRKPKKNRAETEFEINQKNVDKTMKISKNTSTRNSFRHVDVSDIIDEGNDDIFTEKFTLYNNPNRQDSKKHTVCVETVEVHEPFDSGLDSNNEDDNVPEDDVLSEIVGNNDGFSLHNVIDDIQDSEVHSTKNNLYGLIYFIEKELHSNLKDLLSNRTMAKLLETDDYSYWHSQTKTEMTRLENYISRDDLLEYTKHCYEATVPEFIDVNTIEDVIVHKMKSDLRKLFVKREFARNNTEKYSKYSKKIQAEWKRLLNVIPSDYLLVYGDTVMYSIEKLKGQSCNQML